MSNFVSLSTALTAIRAGQFGLDVTTNNVANVNTPGYTRQRVELSERPTYDSAVGPMGTGVDVALIARLRDAFLDARVRTTSSDAAFHDLRTDLLRRAETVTGEPDAGVTDALNGIWDAFEDLANDPANPATRQQVMSALDSLTGRFRSVSRGWNQLETDTRTRRNADLSEVNSLARQVAQINDRVLRAAGGTVPNDVYDARDRALDRLAELTGATPTVGGSTDAAGAFVPDGTVTVTVGGATLVRGAEAGTVSIDTTATPPDDRVLVREAGGAQTIDVSPGTGGITGELGATTTFLRADLPGLRAQLDTLAAQVMNTLNAQHRQGSYQDATGTTSPGGDLLTGTGASDLAIAPGLTGATIAAAGPSGDVHDGDNALALAALRGMADATGSTLDAQARTLVTSIGGAVQNAQRQSTAADELRQAADRARESAHGVSIDEEMVQMVRYQRSLEAASRIMTAVDEALDVLVNRTGLVGR